MVSCMINDISAKSAVSGPTSPIRESWRTLPQFVQPFLDGLSGKPLGGRPQYEASALRLLAEASVAALLGTALAVWGASAGGLAWLVVPLGWIATVHGLRKNDLNAFHEAAHGVLFPGRPVLNNLAGELLGVVHLAQNFTTYGPSHREDHHSKGFATRDDPTFRFLIETLGLRPGMSAQAAWLRLAKALFSPAFHARQLVDRISASARGASPSHWTLTLLYALALVSAGAWAGWLPLLVGWVIPLTILYNMTATVRMCVEHVFPPADTAGRHCREVAAGCTHAIHFGVPAPDVSWTGPLRCVAWLAWGVRMLAYEWPARLLICPGEAVCHDFHHRHPRFPGWPCYVRNRQEDLIAPASPWRGIPYTEVWTLHGAIAECFRTLAHADPKLFVPDRPGLARQPRP
jgi:hypothetical protein